MSIVTRADCRSDDSAPDLCGEAAAAARTALYPNAAPGTAWDGVIEEADIELNAAHFEWALDGGQSKANLRRAIHHELGHVLGLSHSCGFANDLSSKLPSCNGTPFSTELMNPEAAIADGSIALVPSSSDLNELCSCYGRHDTSQARPTTHGRTLYSCMKVFAILLALTAPLALLRRK